MHWLHRARLEPSREVRITEEVSEELRAIPGVRNFGAHIGQALLADEALRHRTSPRTGSA